MKEASNYSYSDEIEKLRDCVNDYSRPLQTKIKNILQKTTKKVFNQQYTRILLSLECQTVRASGKRNKITDVMKRQILKIVIKVDAGVFSFRTN